MTINRRTTAAISAATTAIMLVATLAATSRSAGADTGPVRFEVLFDFTLDDGRNESCSYEKDVVNLTGDTIEVVTPTGAKLTIPAKGSERARIYDTDELNRLTNDEHDSLVFVVDGVDIADPLSTAQRCARNTTPTTAPPTTAPPTTAPPAVCDDGQVGTPPNCTTPTTAPPVTVPPTTAPPTTEPPTCPEDMTGTPPNCFAPPTTALQTTTSTIDTLVFDGSAQLIASPPVAVTNSTPDEELPFTGGSSTRIAMLGAAVLLAGLASIAAARRLAQR